MSTDNHRWKFSWPGNFCLDCGIDDPLETGDALVPCDCQNDHSDCSGTGMMPNPAFKVPPCPAKEPLP